MKTDRYHWLRVLVYLFLLVCGLMTLEADAQSHQFCPTDAPCTWTGAQTDSALHTFNGGLSSTDVIAKGTPWIDVRSYGAKCDGTGDDTVAVQNAYAAAAARTYNRRLYIPGRCVVTVPSNGYVVLVQARNIIVEGCGAQRFVDGGCGFDIKGGPGNVFQLDTDKHPGDTTGQFYDGFPGGFRMEHIYATYSGTNTATLTNGIAQYGIGIHLVHDWRTGTVSMTNVLAEAIESVFWGLDSDENIFTDVTCNYSHNCYHIGAFSEKFKGRFVNGNFANDTVFDIDFANDFDCLDCHIQFSGSLGNIPIKIYSTQGLASSVSTRFINPWLEMGAWQWGTVNPGSPNAFIQIGRDSDAQTARGVVIDRPLLINCTIGGTGACTNANIPYIAEMHGSASLSLTVGPAAGRSTLVNYVQALFPATTTFPVLAVNQEGADTNTSETYWATAGGSGNVEVVAKQLDPHSSTSGNGEQRYQALISRFWNNAISEQDTTVAIRAGHSASATATFQFEDFDGTVKWQLYKGNAGNGNFLFLNDSSKARLRVDNSWQFNPNGTGQIFRWNDNSGTQQAKVDFDTGKGTFNGGVNVGSTVVGSLPTASSNSFMQIGVTDSTAIAAEGQTCVGGGAVKAIAISNGTVWKCF